MITLQKTPGKDFKILNLTDPQLSNGEWAEGHQNRDILIHTLTELVKTVDPDLITITGDLSWAGNHDAYDALADLLDTFGKPWAPVWGNHDNQGGAETVDMVATRYLTHPLCVYEKGDPSLGNGNYVVAIEENGKVVEVKAEKGEDVLKHMVAMDEGAAYLGECALVPQASPIAQSGILFYNTLFDENAACHLALGRGFSECVRGHEEMTLDQIKELGVNDSMIHEDFMIGCDTMNIDAITRDGKVVPIFRSGNWAF